MNTNEDEINSGKRLLNISINALFGYLIVELIGFLARVLDIIDTEYSDILILSSIVNGGTLLFIIIVYKIKNLAVRTIFYTDCIIESRDINKARYGFKRLSSSFQEAPDETAHNTLAFILERFFLFTKGQEIRDDFTVIVARKTN